MWEDGYQAATRTCSVLSYHVKVASFTHCMGSCIIARKHRLLEEAVSLDLTEFLTGLNWTATPHGHWDGARTRKPFAYRVFRDAFNYLSVWFVLKHLTLVAFTHCRCSLFNSYCSLKKRILPNIQVELLCPLTLLPVVNLKNMFLFKPSYPCIILKTFSSRSMAAHISFFSKALTTGNTKMAARGTSISQRQSRCI